MNGTLFSLINCKNCCIQIHDWNEKCPYYKYVDRARRGLDALYSFSQLKNKQVFDVGNKYLGTVEDLLVHKNGKLYGLRIDKNSLFLRDCVIPISKVIKVVEENIQVGKKAAHSLEEVASDCLHVNNEWINRQVVGEKGSFIGLVKDVYFTFQVGMIEILEISEGWFTDLVEGRKYCFFRDLACNEENKHLIVRGGLHDEMPKLYEQKFR